jgi:hypothetical protein
MPTWAIVFLVFAGGLFLVKAAYVLGLGSSLFVTRGALFVGTASQRIRACLGAVPMESGQTFVDLGCGDGRVLRAVRKCYGANAVGYEVNPLAYVTARLRSLDTQGIRVRWCNFWNQDLSYADVIFCYLFPDVMGRLGSKLEGELQPGARVISCNFPIPGWSPQQVLRPPPLRHSDPIYVYCFPDSCRSSQ